MSESLLERLKKEDGLPTAPGIAPRILEFTTQEEPDLSEFAKLITLDPVLAAKMLRTANSAAYGLRREVADIPRAIVVIGFRNASFLALSIAVVSSFKGVAAPAFDYRRFWTRSIASAVAARLLGERVLPSKRDEAFLIGLLADLGELVLAQCAPDEYAPVLDRWNEVGGPIQALEKSQLGTTHPEVGAEILEVWGLPATICGAIRSHHEPHQGGQGEERTRLAEIANLATLCGELLSGAPLFDTVQELERRALGYFELDAEACAAIARQTAAGVPELAEVLELRVHDGLPEKAMEAAEHFGPNGNASVA